MLQITLDDVKRIVYNLVRETAYNDFPVLIDSTDLFHDLRFDSMQIIRLIVHTESSFSITFSDNFMTLCNISTVGEFVNQVYSLIDD